MAAPALSTRDTFEIAGEGMQKAREALTLQGMITFLTILVAVAMLATLGVLLVGIIGMVRGGGDPARSNRLMRYRVLLQGAALLLFALLMTLMKR